MYAGISGEISSAAVLPETYGLRGAVWADAAWIGAPADIGVFDRSDSVDQPLKSRWVRRSSGTGRSGRARRLRRGDLKATQDRTQIFQLTIQNLIWLLADRGA